MKYLLDTNIVILSLTDDPALPSKARKIIDSPEFDKVVSIASAPLKWLGGEHNFAQKLTKQ